MKRVIDKEIYMQLKKVIGLVFLVVVTACATIVHDEEQPVNINSNPPGATLTIDNRTFVTPARIMLKGKSEYYFTLQAPGYQTANGKVDGKFRIWASVVGNIFNLTGLLGFAVDYWGTGTAYELQKDNTVTLQPLQPPAASIAPMTQPYYPSAYPATPPVAPAYSGTAASPTGTAR